MEQSKVTEARGIANIDRSVDLYDDELVPLYDGDRLIGVALAIPSSRTDSTCEFFLFVDYRSDKGFEMAIDAKPMTLIPSIEQGRISLHLEYSR